MVCTPRDKNPGEVNEAKELGEVVMETGLDELDVVDVELPNNCMRGIEESPASSIFLDNASNPPSSDVAYTDDEQYEDHPLEIDLKRRRSVDPNMEEKIPYRMKKQKKVGEVEVGTDYGDDSRGDCGESRSAAASRKLKNSLKAGQFVVDGRKKVVFEEKCRQMDAGAKFRHGEKWEVLHSKCGKWSTMAEPYNTTRFKAHIGNCKSNHIKGRNGCIDDFFQPQKNSVCTMGALVESTGRPAIKARNQVFLSNHPGVDIDQDIPPIITESLPCLGLREEQNNQISKYISRTLTEGAGSRSDSKVTTELFGKNISYLQLGDRGKQFVQAAQVHSRLWTINCELQAIYSTNCQKVVGTKSTENACPECLAILKSKAFKKAVRTEPAPLALKKYIPHRWRTAATNLAINLAEINGLPGLLEAVSSLSLAIPSAVIDCNIHQDSEKSEWIRFVSDVLAGKHNDQKLLLGLISAANERLRREEHQVGLQNFSYTPFLLQFSSALSVITPEGYRLLATQLQLPTIRHHQCVPLVTCSQCV